MKNFILSLHTVHGSPQIFEMLILLDWSGYKSFVRIDLLNLFESLYLENEFDLRICEEMRWGLGVQRIIFCKAKDCIGYGIYEKYKFTEVAVKAIVCQISWSIQFLWKQRLFSLVLVCVQSGGTDRRRHPRHESDSAGWPHCHHTREMGWSEQKLAEPKLCSESSHPHHWWDPPAG